MKLKRIATSVLALTGLAALGLTNVSAADTPRTPDRAIPHYQHIVEIMMENTSYGTIIGNSNAPQINALANKYGLATNYFGVTHPSEPNYMANIAGDYFGVQDDNQFYCTPALATTDPNCSGTTVNHTVNAPTLADQLTAAGLTWKGYFQSLPPTPAPGTLVTTGPNANGPYTFKYPSNSVALYASKHNPFVNFTGTQGALANMVPDTQLTTDLASKHGKGLPNFSLVVPDQCHDMHGTSTCSDTNGLISAGDTYVGNTVAAIQASKVWEQGRNAIVITWDEDDYSDQGLAGTGCCGSNVGGGHVVTIVITNRGNHWITEDQDHGSTDVDHGITDGTAYNHYSLLRTMEDAFGLGYIGHSGDSAVPPMSPLFRP
ncbi:MAG TPA: alkaline phosphatase family protein [Acidimicrobiales bacterium]|nr:alkaline phosphatase family protein [Acidimicrobiales bacterium]